MSNMHPKALARHAPGTKRPPKALARHAPRSNTPPKNIEKHEPCTPMPLNNLKKHVTNPQQQAYKACAMVKHAPKRFCKPCTHAHVTLNPLARGAPWSNAPPKIIARH